MSKIYKKQKVDKRGISKNKNKIKKNINKI